ncbi:MULTISPECIES: methionyl-tRNA formyltransferase [Mammaliicoccus]|jgi:methionyl-tRNA formyltransferase|uniref:methionyl-tRNA formyltransferase n=1 Tax=Mammaliicoccus TaxID=2803850 RepID=UPI0002DDD35E|nr:MULTISPECIES: methionyl-tRNA formyltransferase [Mammaliicoccus]MBW0768201.1 methionyl-tRNA formyltransferase [Mammaliicoccus lentus]WGZ43416.1 methionyl-tRNA formyltransferase [Mammaliicoccus lentus]WQK49096.1 methionyl-tRNA formyltransferase [Mammaliicoccus lentus]WQL54949.1 methionyl-tRNA formyltransferase [Mammaliicoccus lentus]SCU36966.1 methionyl-tRNA formyltransferase [Mammaliicoccus lentus]
MSKIVFMGTPDFSTGVLEMLIQEYDVIAVVTQPDRPVGRKKILTPPPVKKVALEHNIPVYQPEKLNNSSELEEIINLKPDLIVTAAFGQLLPKSLLDAPKHKAINVHASLLPKYRGGAPIHYAVMNGEKKTGITIMYMAEKLDAGNIISQDEVEILENDTVGEVHDKLATLGTELLKKTLPTIFNGTNDSIVQDDSLATFASNISREDERIDWTKDAQTIHNHIRGLSPWPVAYTTMDGKNLKLWRSEIVENVKGEPGEIIETTKDAIIVATGSEDGVALTEIQLAGKKRVKTRDYISGLQSKIDGTKLI